MTPRLLADLAAISEPEWLALRRRGLGSSDAAVVLGVSPWKSPFALYCEKLGLVDDVAESEQMRWGKLLEPVVAEEYARETGRVVTNPRVLLQHETHDFALATPDRYAATQAGVIDTVVEIKTAGPWKADEWQEEPPTHYQIQVQHLLAVTGMPKGSLVVLLGGQRLLWSDVERNDRFIDAMLAAEAEFWRRLELNDPPPADGMEATTSALAALYPKDSGETIALPTDAETWDRMREEALAEMAAAKIKRDLAENHLKALLGHATKGTLAGGGAYTWKLQARKQHVVPGSEFRVLRKGNT